MLLPSLPCLMQTPWGWSMWAIPLLHCSPGELGAMTINQQVQASAACLAEVAACLARDTAVSRLFASVVPSTAFAICPSPYALTASLAGLLLRPQTMADAALRVPLPEDVMLSPCSAAAPASSPPAPS